MGIENFESFVSSNRSQKHSYEAVLSRRDFLKLAAGLTMAVGLSRSSLKNVVEAFVGESDLYDDTDVDFDQVAKSYIALSNEDATKIANTLLLRNDASPSNICGPLAMSILMQWKLNEDNTISKIVSKDSDPYRAEGTIPTAMWLGTPENDPQRYRIVFPPDQYSEYHVKESIGRVDFDNISGVGALEVGDFLYLDGGSFTHYVAISRKDKQGRVYCVSNLHSEEGRDRFIIDEIVLWDPSKKDGYLRNWANGVGLEKTKAGLTGFYLWRRKRKADES